MAVQAVMEAHGIPYKRIEIGWVELETELPVGLRKQVDEDLRRYALELMQDKSQILVERVKTEIIHLLHDMHPMHRKLSVHLSEVLGYNYTYLANTFSELEGITLERYFIVQRVERVKELTVYEDLSLARIADELNYSSVSHLCLQFKKVAAITPAEFRRRCQSGDYVWRAL
jgi:AraC-like DNA-binding protein